MFRWLVTSLSVVKAGEKGTQVIVITYNYDLPALRSINLKDMDKENQNLTLWMTRVGALSTKSLCPESRTWFYLGVFKRGIK